MNIPWERLFPSLPAESFAFVYEQPSQLLDYLRPQLSPLISPLSTCSSTRSYSLRSAIGNPFNPMSTFSSSPSPETIFTTPYPAELVDFLQKYGLGYFECGCEYQGNAGYSMAQRMNTSSTEILYDLVLMHVTP